MTALRVIAPAKINLHLQVLGRRPDGYHEVRTLLQSIDLADELTAETSSDGALELDVTPAGAVPGGAENLVLRAATALRDLSGSRAGVRLRLVKRIPVGAGLGGGSADAAAALVLLDRLWELELGRRRLAEMARRLGSDVPFFLAGGLALGVGRGDEVTTLPDLEPLGVVIVTPAEELPTAAVYGRLEPRAAWAPACNAVTSFVAGCVDEPPWAAMANDLEPAVAALCPATASLVERLRGLGALRAAVTGSGSASFALFRSPEEAERAAARLGPVPWHHVGATLGSAEARLRVEALPSPSGPRGSGGG